MWGYAGFGPCVHLPGFHFGTVFEPQPDAFLCYSKLSFWMPKATNLPEFRELPVEPFDEKGMLGFEGVAFSAA